jgi:hypothetical protein
LLDELMQRWGSSPNAIAAALAQFSRYFFGNVTNPALGELKANDANRIAVRVLNKFSMTASRLVS